MGSNKPIGLLSVSQGAPKSKLRLLAPLRYLLIRHPEKDRYDVFAPVLISCILCLGFVVIEPKPALFGDVGLFKFVRDFLVMAVPFMIGALASVAMGAPGGKHLDQAPPGGPLILGDDKLTLRQFVCHLLGYMSFVAVVTLIFSVSAEVLRAAILSWVGASVIFHDLFYFGGAFILFFLSSVLIVTVLWSLYFLSDIINRPLP